MTRTGRIGHSLAKAAAVVSSCRTAKHIEGAFRFLLLCKRLYEADPEDYSSKWFYKSYITLLQSLSVTGVIWNITEDLKNQICIEEHKAMSRLWSINSSEKLEKEIRMKTQHMWNTLNTGP